MQQAQAAVHVVGGVRYRDAFQKTRTTTFSLFYGGSYGMNTKSCSQRCPGGQRGRLATCSSLRRGLRISNVKRPLIPTDGAQDFN